MSALALREGDRVITADGSSGRILEIAGEVTALVSLDDGLRVWEPTARLIRGAETEEFECEFASILDDISSGETRLGVSRSHVLGVRTRLAELGYEMWATIARTDGTDSIDFRVRGRTVAV